MPDSKIRATSCVAKGLSFNASVSGISIELEKKQGLNTINQADTQRGTSPELLFCLNMSVKMVGGKEEEKENDQGHLKPFYLGPPEPLVSPSQNASALLQPIILARQHARIYKAHY